MPRYCWIHAWEDSCSSACTKSGCPHVAEIAYQHRDANTQFLQRISLLLHCAGIILCLLLADSCLDVLARTDSTQREDDRADNQERYANIVIRSG
jgi:hypothetical protein